MQTSSYPGQGISQNVCPLAQPHVPLSVRHIARGFWVRLRQPASLVHVLQPPETQVQLPLQYIWPDRHEQNLPSHTAPPVQSLSAQHAWQADTAGQYTFPLRQSVHFPL
jgi:hypothetical protein